MAGAHVIGVTMRRFEDRVNPHVMDEIRTANFYERFEWLVNRADGYVAMHGGIGTLAEVTFTWQEISLGMVQKRPLILVGERWRRLFTCFRKNLIAAPDIYDALTIVPTPEKGIAVLRSAFNIKREADAAPPQSLTARAARAEAKLSPAKPRVARNYSAKHHTVAKHHAP
jgi:predicted Rossmann-fold nucleotide-binding protein